MDWEQDNPLSTPLKTPKKLELICSEAIAVYLATKSVPAIELYFPDPITPDINLSNKSPDVLLKDLLALKNWYWKETKSWLGPSSSILRVFISGSFQDILTCLEFPTIRRERQVFNAFIFQILFSHSTGSYPTKCCFPVTHLTENLNTFLYHLGPFELLTIQDSCLMFGVANPYPVLLKNSPSLKHIFISSNSSSGVLESLRKYCKNIEVFEMEINEIEPIEEVENLLCRTFFDDINMTKLLEKANAGEDVPRSFPKLRELYFHSFENYKSISCTLMFLLQYFYPGIRTEWCSNMWKVRDLLFCTWSASHYPSFVRGKKFQLDYIDTCLSHSLLDTPSTPPPKFFKTTYIQIFDRHTELIHRNVTIEELMKYFDCNNLVFRFLITDDYVTESINRIGQNLNELYLHTIIKIDDHVWKLLTIISKCINLKVLSVEVILESSADCECEEVDFQLLHLESLFLGVFSRNYQQGMTTKFWIPREFQSSCGDAGVKTTASLERLNDVNNRSNPSTGITSGEDGSMSTVFNALDQRCSENRSHQDHSNDQCTCRNFSHENRFSTRNKLVDALDVVEEKMCLISPARNGRSDRIEFEKICVRYMGDQLLSQIDIEARYSYYKLNEVSRIAKIKRDFSGGSNDLPIKFFEIQALHIKPSEGTFRNGQFGFGFYGNGSHGVGYYGYGIDGFGFYGHGVQGYGFYGYGASGFGFYGTNIHTYRTEFHGNGKSGYGLYSMNVNRGYTYYINEIKDVLSSEYCPSKKCSDTAFDASTRHALKYKRNEFTEQEDIGSSDPPETDMITRLLLWIVSKCPNLKTLELPGRRLRDLIWLSQRGYLRRVCTLKISNTFSLEVKRILEDIPSLSLLIIDGLNGMSNFNKYKEFFRTTGLKVEFYDTRLVNPRSSILDFDKTRFKL